jgi:uncharacterized membrane protein YesL
MAIFSHGSRFMRFMEQLLDVLLLNLLWFAFCIPLVTIGASTVAAYRVALKMIDDEESHPAKSFLKAFKDNFRQGTALWILNAVALYALYIEWQIILKSPNPSVFFVIIGILSSAFIFCTFVYAYPQTARYENKLRYILRNSFRISIRYWAKTLILILTLAIEVVIFIWNLPMQIAGGLVGPMILLYTISGISKRIFQDIERTGGKHDANKAAT